MSQNRYLPVTDQDKKNMLSACGAQSIEDLLHGIPDAARFQKTLECGEPLSEFEIKRRITAMTQNSRNKKGALSFLGAGVYDHFCPSVVNQLTLRGEFLTSYTPYQAEMAQGTLQAIFEFQSMIAEIFGMEISNASLYDGATSLAEGALMATRIQGSESTQRKRILVSEGVHPEYIEVLKTYLTNFDMQISLVPLSDEGKTSVTAMKSLLNEEVSLVVVQSPNFLGCIEDMDQFSDMAHAKGALFCANVTEPLSLALLKTPGEYQADIATGEGQSLGLPQSFGGPYVGLFTSRREYARQMPGRLCGETVDTQGRRSFTLTLNTREQHIRREKATSNICTNQNLCALWSTIWLSLVGKNGFCELAQQNLAKAEYAKAQLAKTGKAKIRFARTESFNEFVVDLNVSAEQFIQKCVENNLAPGLALQKFFPSDKTGLLIAVTEKKTRDDIDALVSLVKSFA